MATKAFSYLRFSTAEQERGDSFRRQRDLAVRYCAEHELELDGRSFHDLGISGYRGANVRNGALGAFLRAIDDGAIQSGEYLLVENLDRVSRQDPWEALPVFQQIINAGVIVVTLQDRRRFCKATLKAQPFLIMESLLGMLRAHQESEAKSVRLRSVWAAKRATIADKPLTARCPAWLTLEPIPPRKFVIDEARASVVRRIFELTLSGVGQEAIAKRFNREGVPIFGKAGYWQRSYLCKILGNPAVIGDFQPHIDEHIGGKRSRQPLETVRDYYPAIVDRKTFEAVRTMRADRKRPPRPHGEVRSLVAGLASCPRCEGSMTRVSKASSSKPGKPYLVCSSRRYGGGCNMPAVPFETVEQGILAGVDMFTKDVPTGMDEAKNELAAIDRNIAGVSADLARVGDAIRTGDELGSHRPAPLVVIGVDAAREQVRLQRGGKRHRPHLVALNDELERDLYKLQGERRKQEERIAAVDGPTLRARLREVKTALTAAPLDCARANVALRALFSKIVIDRDERVLVLRWHFGGSSTTSFNPTPVARRSKDKSERIRELFANRPDLSVAEVAASIPCKPGYVRVVRSRGDGV